MNRTIAILAIAAALATAGCTQTDGDGTTGPADVNPTVTLTAPQDGAQVTAGQAFTVEWSVEPEPSGDHEIPHTGVHWADHSVDAGPATGPGAYGNTSGATDATIPDSFSTQVTIDDAGTIYLRAHAIADDGTNYWSAEVTLDVQSGSTDGDGGSQTVHTVDMVSTSYPGFEPMEITIQAGEGVQWENVDSTAHTATADDDSWDAGNVDPGATSQVITFDSPGTYDYHCEYHGLMDGSIVVEA